MRFDNRVPIEVQQSPEFIRSANIVLRDITVLRYVVHTGLGAAVFFLSFSIQLYLLGYTLISFLFFWGVLSFGVSARILYKKGCAAIGIMMQELFTRAGVNINRDEALSIALEAELNRRNH